jgi:hypothetical protein
MNALLGSSRKKSKVPFLPIAAVSRRVKKVCDGKKIAGARVWGCGCNNSQEALQEVAVS